MRIAPRPKPGQEVSLESILKGSASAAPIDPKEFSVKIGKESMVVTGVQLIGHPYTFEVKTQLLEPELTHVKFLENGAQRHRAGDFRPASTEEIYALFSTLVGKADEYRGGDQRLFLQASRGIDKIKEIWTEYHPLYTFTEIDLELNLPDKITHNPGTSLEHKYEGEFAGKDGLIRSRATCAKKICKALFDERDVQKVNDVFSVITGTGISINRDESPQHNPISGVVLIGKEYIVAGGIMYVSQIGFHSLGVRITEVGK